MPGAVVDDLSAEEWEREQRLLSNERKARQVCPKLSSPARSTPQTFPTKDPVGGSSNMWRPHQAWQAADTGTENSDVTLRAPPVSTEQQSADSGLTVVSPTREKEGRLQRQKQEATNEW